MNLFCAMTYVLAPNQTVKAFPYSIEDLRRDNPNTSFPSNISDLELSSWDVFPVSIRPAPQHNLASQNCRQTDPVLESGEWVMKWEVTPASAEEIAERAAVQASMVRAERTRLLAASDWTQLIDAPVNSADWQAYRQALRDIPSQSGFPWSVEWPVEPVV